MPHRIDVLQTRGEEVIDKFMISSGDSWDRICQKHTYPHVFLFFLRVADHFLHAQGTDRH